MLSIDRQHDLSSLPPSNIILLHLPRPNCGAHYLELTKEGFLFLMEAGPLARRMAKQRDVILGLHRVLSTPIAAGIYFVENLLPNLTQSSLSKLWFCCITNLPKIGGSIMSYNFLGWVGSAMWLLFSPCNISWGCCHLGIGLGYKVPIGIVTCLVLWYRRQEDWAQLCRWSALHVAFLPGLSLWLLQGNWISYTVAKGSPKHTGESYQD